MRSHTQAFHDIESDATLLTLQFQQHQVWSIIRNKCWHHLLSNVSESPAKAARPLSLLKNIFYGIGALFHSYELLCFSHTINRNEREGYFRDRFTEPISDLIGQHKSCTIELTNDRHYPKCRVASRHIISHISIKALGLLLSKFIYVPRMSRLDAINTQYGIQLNYRKELREFLASYRIWLLLLRLWRPKKIVVVCYYSYIDVIAAAHRLGIEVIEVQHGMIGGTHLAYHSNLECERQYLPDTLLTFGTFDAKQLSRSPLFRKTASVPIGSCLLEEACQHNSAQLRHEKRQQLLADTFECMILVTAQATVEKELVAFMKTLAPLQHRYLYLFLPRRFHAAHTSVFHDHPNIIIPEHDDFYTLLPLADVHATVYSTCALEASYCRLTNILIDINGLASKHMQSLLRPNHDAYYVETPEEMLACISSSPKVTSTQQSHFFASGYHRNLQHYFNGTANV